MKGAFAWLALFLAYCRRNLTLPSGVAFRSTNALRISRLLLHFLHPLRIPLEVYVESVLGSCSHRQRLLPTDKNFPRVGPGDPIGTQLVRCLHLLDGGDRGGSVNSVDFQAGVLDEVAQGLDSRYISVR